MVLASNRRTPKSSVTSASGCALRSFIHSSPRELSAKSDRVRRPTQPEDIAYTEDNFYWCTFTRYVVLSF